MNVASKWPSHGRVDNHSGHCTAVAKTPPGGPVFSFKAGPCTGTAKTPPNDAVFSMDLSPCAGPAKTPPLTALSGTPETPSTTPTRTPRGNSSPFLKQRKSVKHLSRRSSPAPQKDSRTIDDTKTIFEPVKVREGRKPALCKMKSRKLKWKTKPGSNPVETGYDTAGYSSAATTEETQATFLKSIKETQIAKRRQEEKSEKDDPKKTEQDARKFSFEKKNTEEPKKQTFENFWKKIKKDRQLKNENKESEAPNKAGKHKKLSVKAHQSEKSNAEEDTKENWKTVESDVSAKTEDENEHEAKKKPEDVKEEAALIKKKEDPKKNREDANKKEGAFHRFTGLFRWP